MSCIAVEFFTRQEISNRIDLLRAKYAGDPLVERIDHRVGVDWSDDPAVFIDVTLPASEIATAEWHRLAENMLGDLLRVVSHG